MTLTGKDTIATSMLVPLLVSLLGFTLYFGAVLLVRLRAEILRRERAAAWIREALRHESQFLDMGSYAAYVWPSYGLTFAVIVPQHRLGAACCSRTPDR